jgi:hypothetical protein
MGKWKGIGRYAYLVVDLAPSLILNVVMFESLKTVDADIEIGGVKN